MSSSYNSVAGDLQDRAQKMGQQVQGAAEDVRRAARDGMNQAREAAGEYMEQGRQRAVALEHTLETQIRQQPLQAMLVAAGVGFLLGVVCLRR